MLQCLFYPVQCGLNLNVGAVPMADSVDEANDNGLCPEISHFILCHLAPPSTARPLPELVLSEQPRSPQPVPKHKDLPLRSVRSLHFQFVQLFLF